MPNKRRAETLTFTHGGQVYTATLGWAKGESKVREIFLNGAKIGSSTDLAARDAAIAVSLALQHGADLTTIRQAMGRQPDGSPSSPIGALLDIIDLGAIAGGPG